MTKKRNTANRKKVIRKTRASNKGIVAKEVIKKRTTKRKTAKRKSEDQLLGASEPSKKGKGSSFKKLESGIVVHSDLKKEIENTTQAVRPSVLKKGFDNALKELKELLKDTPQEFSNDFVVKEYEVNVSFNAEGKFLGVGIGGATSIKIKIAKDDL